MLQSRHKLGLESSEGLTGVAGSLPKWRPHTHGELMLAVGMRPQFLATWTSPEGCLGVLMTQQLVSTRDSDPVESMAEATISFLSLSQKPHHVPSPMPDSRPRSALLIQAGTTHRHEYWEAGISVAGDSRNVSCISTLSPVASSFELSTCLIKQSL